MKAAFKVFRKVPYGPSTADFSFTTGNPDGLMGAASRRASPGKLETETADDFTLDQTTVIGRATSRRSNGTLHRTI
jgi:hypothetical protein